MANIKINEKVLKELFEYQDRRACGAYGMRSNGKSFRRAFQVCDKDKFPVNIFG